MTGERPLKDFIAAFGDDPMILPDCEVVGSDRMDWGPILREFSRSRWVPTWSRGAADVVEASQLQDPSRDGDVFYVRPIPGLRINFFAGAKILFDLDLRELTSDRALQVLYDVITRVGVASGKRVTVSQEGTWDDVVVVYDPTAASFRWATA